MAYSMWSDQCAVHNRPPLCHPPTASVGRGGIIRIAALQHRAAFFGGRDGPQRTLLPAPTSGPLLASRPRATVVPRAALASMFATLAPDMAHHALVAAKLFSAFVAVGTGLLAAAAWLDAKRKTQKPEVQYAPTQFNERVLRTCPTLELPYEPLPFLTNPHVETILAAKTRSKPALQYRREILKVADGGAVALDWHHLTGDQVLPDEAPVLILLPGLTGGSCDSYVLHAVQSARRAGIRAVVFNSRGTADSPVLTPQFYSASFTCDTRAVVAHVARRYPRSRALMAAGWSLGANILLRYLGEDGAATPLRAAVSMCNPFDLVLSNKAIRTGFSRIYDLSLAAALQRIFAKHRLLWTGMPPPFRVEQLPSVKSVRDFDECITIHSFGWRDVDEYYVGSSSSLSVPHITIPTLCIQAVDDPIAPIEGTPFKALRENPNFTLVTTLTGGHLGWVAGPEAPFGAPWTDKVMFEWLNSVMRELNETKVQPSDSAADLVNTQAQATVRA